MGNPRLTYLFHLYVNDSCTERERLEFLEFVQDGRHEAQLRELMEKLWEEIPAKKIDARRSNEILNCILKERNRMSPLREHPLLRIAVAASLVLIAVFSGVLFYDSDPEASTSHHSDQQTQPEPKARFIKLPDGSFIILNAGSKLTYSLAFNGHAREVSLTGEAYFDIAHDSVRPFIVHTGKIKTTVLGTAFNIKAYPGQSDITVTVTRGQVKVSDDKKVLGVINPDQQITFNTADEHAEQKQVDSHQVTSWMERDIFFDDVTIAEAIEQLEKRFDISVELANPNISSCRFTATFVKGEDVEHVLRILCDFNNAQLEQGDSGEFVIRGGECPQ